MSVSLRSWWVISERIEAEELRSSAENREETIFSRLRRSLLATSPQKHMSVTRKIVLLGFQAIFRIEVKFDKLSFCTFLYKTCF